MVGKTILAIAVALVSTAPLARAADPVGSYSVVGSNPGSGSQYAGTATVERTDDTLRVTWVIAGVTYIGTGIDSDNGFADAASAARLGPGDDGKLRHS